MTQTSQLTSREDHLQKKLRFLKMFPTSVFHKVIYYSAIALIGIGSIYLARLQKEGFTSSLTLVIVGLAYIVYSIARDERKKLKPKNISFGEVIIVLFLLFIGTVLRFASVNYFPPPLGLSIPMPEEAISGLRAHQILSGQDFWSLHAPIFTMAYPTALFFYIFGEHIRFLRIPFILAGVFTLSLFYLFSRQFFNKRVSLLALALLIVSRWHIAIGKVAIDWIHVPLLEILCFYTFWKGWFKDRRYFILHGFFIGICLLSYFALRAVLIIEILFLVILFASRRGNFKKNLMKASEYFLFIILFSLPALMIFRNNPTIFFGEHVNSKYSFFFKKDAISAAPYILKKLVTVLRNFWDQEQSLSIVNIKGWAMIDKITIIFALVGYLISFCKIKKEKKYLFFHIWFWVILLSGGVLIDPFYAHRLVGLIPVMMLFAGLGIHSLLSFVLRGTKKSIGSVLYLSAASIILLAVGRENLLKLKAHMETEQVRQEFRQGPTYLCLDMKKTQGKIYHMSKKFSFKGDYRWICGDKDGEEGYSFAEVIPDHRFDDTVFYFVTNEFSLTYWEKYIKSLYGNVPSERRDFPEEKFAYQKFQLDAADIAKHRTLLYKEGLWQGSVYIPQTKRYEISYDSHVEKITVNEIEMANGAKQNMTAGWYNISVVAEKNPIGNIFLNGEKIPKKYFFDKKIAYGIEEIW